MKTIAKGSLLVWALSVSAFYNAQERIIEQKDLPKQSQQFISKNFKNQKVTYAEKDATLGIVEDYKAVLDNGTKVKFSRNGDWKEVENKQQGVPRQIVPAKIANYVKQNYRRTFITKIDKKSRGGYDVDLSNGLELEFNAQGQLVKIDN